ncbi:MAG: hypothetical protein KC592_19105 [Nitrospira sp.]|nr:hypothetical protein [Nitrospira sp.]MCW5783633.1 hypothetical protein [Nitrospirales bacterium]
MKKIMLIGVLVLLGASLAYCQHFWFPYTWHQKMTLEVEADGQRYTGSSVVEVSWRQNDPIGAANGPEWIGGIRGEAPYVEVPGHGVLFGLISFAGNSSYAADLATQVITDRKGVGTWPTRIFISQSRRETNVDYSS